MLYSVLNERNFNTEVYMLSFLLSIFVSSSLALAPGETAPTFSLLDQQGKEVSLDGFKGKKVVLEWYNQGCPFVRKHYDSGNMQETQEFAKSKDIVWLTIVSSAPGKQGYIENSKAALAQMGNEKSKAQHLLLDSEGKVGRLYDAKTTPEMFLIDETGKIAYMGAIDSIASADQGDIKKAVNYVHSAIDNLSKGQAISPAKSRSYGCSVKY